MKGKHAKTTAKKLKLAKRTLALCFAVVFLCSCMLPVFATGSSLTDVLREAVEETTASMEESTGSTGGTMMDSFQSYYADYIAEKATTYRFWLDEKDSYDLDGVTSTSASELAQYDDFYKVVKIENNAPLSAPDGFKNPTDPTGAGRKFEGWYYIDTYGLTQTFTFSGDIQSIDTDSTVDVFAKWGEAPAEAPATEEPKDEKTTEEDTKTEETPDVEETEEDKKTTKEDSVPPYPFDDGEETTSDEETADDEIMTTSLYDDMVSATAATDANYTVSVGKTVDVKGTAGDYDYYGYHDWSSSDKSIATVSKTGTGSTATVTGKKAGRVTLTHKYYVWVSSGKYSGYAERSEQFTVEVTSTVTTEQDATVFILLTPSSNKDSNATGDWGYGIPGAKVDVTGATWENNKNIKQNVSDYVRSWPGSMNSVTIKDGDKYVQAWDMPLDTIGYGYVQYDRWGNILQDTETMLDQIWGKWSEEIKRDIGDNDLTKGDIEHVYIVPYKISKDNGTSGVINSTHIDSEIRVVCGKVFTAKFHVQPAGELDYTQISSKNYKITNNIKDNVPENNGYEYKKDYPLNKTVNGVEYVFDGWYNEDGVKVDDWTNYVPTDDELEGDNIVNFYAHYVRTTTEFTIQKKVTGNMADLEEHFEFTVSVKDSENKPLSFELNGVEYATGTADFELSDGESVKLTDVPVGAIVTITEKNADGYTVNAKLNSATVGEANQTNGGTFTFVVAEATDIQSEGEDEVGLMLMSLDDAEGDIDPTSATTGTTVLVINSKDLEVPTGVILDTLPYILMLAAVGAGVVIFIFRKRHHDDD